MVCLFGGDDRGVCSQGETVKHKKLGHYKTFRAFLFGYYILTEYVDMAPDWFGTRLNQR